MFHESPNYSNADSWAVKPDKYPEPLKKIIGDSESKDCDVFFIYPTMFLDRKDVRWNADINNEELNKQIKNLSQFVEFYSEDNCSEKNAEIEIINAIDFNSLYKANPNKILLIDVRENEEFSTSAIEGSISLPLSHLNQKPELGFIQKESLIKEVFTICKTGKRSEKATKILSEFSIQSRSIEGGIEKVKKLLND